MENSSLILKIQHLLESLGIHSHGPVARGALISVLIRVLALGLAFLQAIITARLLGAEGYGTVAYAISIATIASTFAMLGLGPLAVREVSRLSVRADWPNLRGFLHVSGIAVTATSTLSGGAIAGLAFATDLFDEQYRNEIVIAAAMIPSFALILYFRGVHQGFGRILFAQLPGDLLRPIIFIAALGLFSLTGWRMTTAGYLVIGTGTGFAAVAIAVVMFWVTTSQCLPRVRSTLSARPWANAASPFLAMAILGVLGAEVNTLLLGWLAGPKETGLFQPIARIVPVMLIGLQAVSIPFAPRVAALWEQGELARLSRLTWKVTVTTTGVTIAICTIIVLLAPLIFSAFGDVFVVATGAVLVVSAAQIFNTACGPVGLLLSMSGHQGTAVRCQVAGLLVNTILGLWLIPTSGAYGAAIAFSGGIATWNILMLIAVGRELGFDASIFGARLLVARTSGE